MSNNNTTALHIEVPANLKIVALPTKLNLDGVKAAAMRTIEVPETGSYPCRRCLRDAEIGDTVLLVPYDPFLGDSPYRQHGPIYVHANNSCEAYKGSANLPEQLRKRLLSMRSFDRNHCMVGCDAVQGEDSMGVASKMLGNEAVEYVHLHNAKAGCFAARVERA